MSVSRFSKRLSALLGILLCGASYCAGQDSRLIGSQSCNSATCHGRTEPRGVPGGLGLQEFGLYAQHDPHARAAQTLQSSEFQAILSRFSQREEGAADSQTYAKCAQCHDPEGIAAAQQEGTVLAPPFLSHTLARGIGCESCHGGAKDWLTRHYQRGVSASSLAGLGMLDTENLHARARLCASCHVGDADRDMNHDMIAAGHPPLRFELSAYHRKLTRHDATTGRQSHWDDARERITTKDFETQLWAAGQLAVAERALALLESRAHRAAADESASSWPEFAEYDCFGCHQPLRPQAGGGRALELGLPAWGKWNFALAPDPSEAPLAELRGEMRKAFTAEPLVAERAAAKAHGVVMDTPAAHDMSAHSLLQRLSKPISDTLSWDALCHRYLGLLAIEKTIGDEFQKLELGGGVSPVQRNAFNGRRQEIDAALRAVGDSLSFADDKKEWPRALSTADGLNRASAALDAVAEKLRALQTFLEHRQ